MRFFSLRLAILLTIGVSLVNASCSPQNEVANRTERHSQGNGAFQNDAYVQHRTETSQGYAEVEVPESKASRFPIRYRIGSIDPRFNLSSDDALRATNQAIRMWESAANKQLFEYDPKDGFAIDFVFDQRQETLAARELAKEQLRIGKASLELSSEREQQAAAQFRNTRQRLESEEQAFNSRLDDYNRRVGTWNASGGAPADTISDLNSEKESIGSERARLQQAEQDLDAMRNDANSARKAYNEQAMSYNEAVHDYNEKYGSHLVQTVGECLRKGDEVEGITIYAFNNSNDLMIVLAHELGHAIGLGHVTGEGAVMSAVENGERYATQLELTNRDKVALRTALDR